MRQDLRSYVTVDLDAIADNISAVKNCIEPDVKVMAVIKTDGYGHGIMSHSSGARCRTSIGIMMR